MKLTLRKEVGFYEITPTGYRPAWTCEFRGIAACYPFGIHYVAMLIRWLWKKTWWVPFGSFERDIIAAKRESWEQGFATGYAKARQWVIDYGSYPEPPENPWE